MNVKSIFASKTFWFAVLKGAAGAGLAAFHPDPNVKTLGAGAIATSVIDVGLRMLTNQGVSVGGTK